MFELVAFSLLFIYFNFYINEHEHYYKEIKKELLFIVFIICFIVYVIDIQSVSDLILNLLLFLSTISIIFLFYKKKDEIVAKQMKYWNIKTNDILNKNKHQIVKKNGRNELKKQEDEYFYNENITVKQLLPAMELLIKNYNDFTIIKNTKDISNISPVYSEIYKRIQEIAKDNENDIKYDDVLEANKYCAEFFLIDLWEQVCFNEILGVIALDTIAQNEKDTELIGAIDAVKSSSILKDGFYLYSHYLISKNFKYRV